jgi:hypothetical protein
MKHKSLYGAITPERPGKPPPDLVIHLRRQFAPKKIIGLCTSLSYILYVVFYSAND